MPRYRLLVFDWDGTLIDSAAAIVESLQSACVDIGLERPEDARARHIIGLGLRDALQYLVPELDERDYGRLVERYRVHFLVKDPETRLFAGIEAGLTALRESGHLLAIATGKSRRGLERALDQTGLRMHFTASRCADEGYSKPHPGMLQAVMEEVCAGAEETLMIGDTTHDLQMAANAGCAAVGVSYGAHDPGEFGALKPLYIAHSVGQLRDWLRENA